MSATAWTCPLYHVNFIVVVCREKNLPAELTAIVPPQLHAEVHKELITQAETASGFCTRVLYDEAAKRGTIIIWVEYATWPRFAEFAAHESLHAAEKVLSRIGMTMNEHTVEAFTYYQGKILRRILELR